MATRALSVGEVIDHRPLGAYQIWTIVLCGLVLVMDGYDAFTMSYVTSPVSRAMHIPIHSFGPILSASLIGLMIASLATGPIADRVGRKWVIILSELTFAAFSLLTAHATTYHELWMYRFLTGLGLGGAMPNAVALASEYSPKRLIAPVVATLFAGMPIGAVLSGVVSSAVIGSWGWKWVFYIGGIVPDVLALALVVKLPESVRFMAARKKDPRRIETILARIAPDVPPAQIDFTATSDETARKGVPVKHLFTEGRAVGTILLWIPYFMNLMGIYFMNSWLPSLLKEAGMTVSHSVLVTAGVSFGGIFACFAEGPLINAVGAFNALIGEFVLSAVCILGVAEVARSFGPALIIGCVMGFLLIGAQAGLNAMAAKFYPTPIRSTGVGWALGVGRVGSVVGPLVGGMMLTAGWKPKEIIISGAVCGVLGWLAIWLSKHVRGVATAYDRDARAIEAPTASHV